MTEFWLIGGFFAFVLLAITTAGYFILARQGTVTASAEAAPRPRSTVLIPESVNTDGFGAIVRAFQLVGLMIPGARAENNPLRRDLVAAGYRMPSAVSTFYGLKCATSLTLAALGAWAAATSDTNFLLPCLGAAGFGFLLPDRILDRVISARAQRLKRGLPAALDMMVLAVEAGQSVDQALIATSRGLKNSHPDLCTELTILHLESRASNNRVEALRSFANRNTGAELKKFAALMIDTDRFGTSIGPALRDHAKYLRIRLRQKAQEQARKVGVKLIFPVFFLIFPSVLLVTLGPAVILIFTQLKAMVGN
jgi:tight adherence protein C